MVKGVVAEIVIEIEEIDLGTGVVDLSNLDSIGYGKVVVVKAKVSILLGLQREGLFVAWVGNSFDWRLGIAFG